VPTKAGSKDYHRSFARLALDRRHGLGRDDMTALGYGRSSSFADERAPRRVNKGFDPLDQVFDYT
jgi:hypothetical protein